MGNRFGGRGIRAALAPKPLLELHSITYYAKGDQTHSRIDLGRFVANRRSNLPVDDFVNDLSCMSNLRARGHDVDDDFRRLLSRWSASHALSHDNMNLQPNFVRQWVAAAIGVCLIKMGAAEHDRAPFDLDWFLELMNATRAFHDARPVESRNNHFSWALLSVTAAAILTGDEALATTARDGLRSQIELIHDDGTIDRELERGSRAAHYHAFYAAPLAVCLVLLNRYWSTYLPENHRHINHLISLVSRLEARDAHAMRLFSVPQERMSSQSWIDVYDAEFGTRHRIEDGHSFIARLGGDTRLL